MKRYYYKNGLGFLKDREEELWLTLFSVCAVAAPDRLKALESVAIQLAAHKESCEADEHGVALLRDIRCAFERHGTDRMATSFLVNELLAIEDSPWASWSRGKGLDARSLARLLRPFRISPQNLRFEAEVMKGYLRDDFRESWANYVPGNTSATPLQPA